MTAFQTGGDIYYRTVQTIRPNTELLVWYGDDYAAELGLISVRFLKTLDVINICKIAVIALILLFFTVMFGLFMPKLSASIVALLTSLFFMHR